MEKRMSIIGLNLSVFSFMFGVGVIVPLLPQQIISHTGSLETVGYLASAFALPFVLLQFPMGHLAGRYGFRRFILTGYFLCSASGLIYWRSTTQEIIFFGRMIQGLGEAPLWALAPALLCTVSPQAKGKMIGWYNASLHLGLTLGSLFGTLTSGYVTNDTPFLLFSALGCLSGLVVFASVKQTRIHPRSLDATPDTAALRQLLKAPATLAVFTGILLYGAGYGICLTVLPGFLIESKGFTPDETGWFFTLFYVGISLSQMVTGPLSDRQGRRPTMVLGLAMAALGFGLFSQQTGGAIFIWLFLTSAGLGVFCVSSLSWLNHRVEDSLKGSVSGGFYLFWGMGFFCAPLIFDAPTAPMAGFNGFHILALIYLFQAVSQAVIRQPEGSPVQRREWK